MSKGKSGQQIAQENIALVEAWVEERNACRDWHEYEYSGRLNRTVLASELGIAKSVCTQNKAVRQLIEDADEIWFRKAKESRASHEAARERAEKRTNQISSSNSALNERIGQLEAENRQLRQELAAYKKQQALIQAGAPGLKI